MTELSDYQYQYRNIHMERQDGILEVRLHSESGPLKWGAMAHSIHAQLGNAFSDIGRDENNRVVILTGTGNVFCTEMEMTELPGPDEQGYWHRILREGRSLLMNLLDIPVPVISAINGPATIHAELPLLSDIVLASDATVFGDDHFSYGTVPGDGAHVIWPQLLGHNRGRYFLLTGQRIVAEEALTPGLVSEVLPADMLMPRARELAADIGSKPIEVLRYTRSTLTHRFKRKLLDELGYGLAVEGLALG